MRRIRNDTPLLISLGATMVLFVVGRLAGASVFDNGWSFAHWDAIPLWYVIGWFSAAAAIAHFGFHNFESISGFFNRRSRLLTGGLAVLILLVVFRFDSFLFGGGNIRVGLTSGADDTILRWYEFGSMMAATTLGRLYELIGLKANAAAVYAWRTLSFAATVLSLVAAWKIARALATDKIERLGLFVLTFVGPQFLLYFGFIGIEPVIVAVILWFLLMAVRVTENFSWQPLFGLWGISVLGIVLHITLVALLPAAIFVTLSAISRRQTGLPVLPLLVGVTVLIAGIVLLYVRASGNLELASAILLAGGKEPHLRYGLFSGRHLGDILQVAWLLFPLLLVLKASAFRQLRTLFADRLVITGMLLWLSCFTVLFILDPSNSIVLDLPRLAAYLTPGGFLLALMLRSNDRTGRFPARTFGLTAAVAIILPLSYLPGYLQIARAEAPVTAYLDKHPAYYRTAVIAFRDGYFEHGDIDAANRWDQSYLRLSPDYLSLKGISEFAQAKKTDEALRSLAKLIIRNRYWSEPRALYGSIQMDLGRYAMARPQIDTALMLEPYARGNQINNYAYYRNIGNYRRALEAVHRAAELFPHDDEIVVDVMIIEYRNGNYETARTMADSLVAADATTAYPYAIKGFIADREKRFREAVEYYERFADLAPEDPDAPALRKRANELFLLLRDGSASQ